MLLHHYGVLTEDAFLSQKVRINHYFFLLCDSYLHLNKYTFTLRLVIWCIFFLRNFVIFQQVNRPENQ